MSAHRNGAWLAGWLALLVIGIAVLLAWPPDPAHAKAKVTAPSPTVTVPADAEWSLPTTQATGQAPQARPWLVTVWEDGSWLDRHGNTGCLAGHPCQD